jgi:hypothetical protein
MNMKYDGLVYSIVSPRFFNAKLCCVIFTCYGFVPPPPPQPTVANPLPSYVQPTVVLRLERK